MGFPPPPDGPPIEVQDAISADASFQPGPPVASLCGYTIPSYSLSLSLNANLPGFPPKFPPNLILNLGLNCSADNPLDVSAGFAYGGGRKATFDKDPDDSN